MFDDLAALKPKNIRDRNARLFGLAFGVDVKDNEVAISEGTFDVTAYFGKLLLQILYKAAKACGTIADQGIVLNITGAEMRHASLVREVDHHQVHRQHRVLRLRL